MTIIQGHRRFAALKVIAAAEWRHFQMAWFKVKLKLDGEEMVVETFLKPEDFQSVWCKVYPFDEREAFLHLLTLQNGCDPFDSRELAKAARAAVELDIDLDKLPGVMHRTKETVQLYLDLGKLPHRSQEAVFNRGMALETAGQMLRLMELTDKETVEEATLLVMDNAITGEPMSAKQAEIYLQNHYFKPLEWQRAWVKLAKDLQKRKHLVSDGFSYIDWAQRKEFVMEESLPQTAFALAEEYIDSDELVNPREPMTWGALAKVLGVPVFVCPAPRNVEKYLLLVKRAAVRDGDSVSDVPVLRGKGDKRKKLEREFLEGQGEAGDEFEVSGLKSQVGDVDGAEGESEAEVSGAAWECRAPGPEFPMEFWRGVLARLMGKPEAVMQDGLWQSMIGAAWRAAKAVVPAEVYVKLLGDVDRDDARRGGLRGVFMALLACSLAHADEEDEEAMEDVKRVLGME
ncbi:hypothetical protein [Prosthecobacter sp.]|uniref:hypothetical protein n=1 Tax=Prosthecobacter sp. TaxID=1965333 RepID=UPI003783FE9E